MHPYTPNFIEVGSTGLKRYGGWILDDFVEELQSWPQVCGIFEEMANSATIGALLRAIQQIAKNVRWYVHPKSQSREDLEAAEFIDSCFEDMEHPFQSVIDDALTMLPYGWALEEIVYKQRLGPLYKDPTKHSKFSDGRIGIRKIPLRAQRTLFSWIFAEDGDQRGDVIAMRQLSPPDYEWVDIPLSKCLLFRVDPDGGNPQGRSILRSAVRCFQLKSRLEVVEGISTERDLTGLPVLKIPASVITSKHEDAKHSYQELVQGIKRGDADGVVLPSDAWPDTVVNKYDLKLLTSGGAKQYSTREVIRRYDQQILSTVLADFLIPGTNDAHVIHTVKQDVFNAAITGVLDVIAEEINRKLIPQLLTVNLLPGEATLKHSNPAGTDLRMLGKYIKSLKFAGVPIEHTAEEHLKDVASLNLN